MASEFLSASFVERVERLALGLTPLDALRGGRVADSLDVALDGIPYPVPPVVRRQRGLPDDATVLRRVARHRSCRHALLYRAGLPRDLKVRFLDGSRRYVPRRISYRVPASPLDVRFRVKTPHFFPGAAYDVSETATGLRGRATWTAAGETPVRWARVVARLNGVVVGRAHGDDRGEFLLLLDSAAGGLGDLPTSASPLIVEVAVFAPAAPPPANPLDPFADLPLETVGEVEDPTDVSLGTALPPGYGATATSTRNVTFPLGTILTKQPKFSMS